MEDAGDMQDAVSSKEGDRSQRPAIDPKRLLIDASVSVGLLVALGLVFALDRGRGSGDAGLLSEADVVEVIPEDEMEAAGGGSPLRLAVTPPEFDDMGKLLSTLGIGYQYTQIPLDDLLDADRLARHDVVFVTCGGVPREWLAERLRDSERGTAGVYRARLEIVQAIHESFRKFVGHGGTLYVSDLQFDLLSIAFPEFVDEDKVGRGAVQDIEAEVVDPALEHVLGPTIPLRFDKPSWRLAAFRGPDLTTYLRGSCELLSGGRRTAPLLISFTFGEGAVVFTSFHNEKQNTQMELDLLRHLVFTTVTAREQAEIKRTMVRGGFSPTERSLLSASTDSKPVRQTYRCEKRGPLQFVLGFEDQGARLRLTVVGPDGYQAEKTGAGTFRIDVADAAAGRWEYTITPLEIPYENFPFTLTVGEKR